MTPPDWFLQVLGGAGIVLLVALLWPVLRALRASRPGRQRPERVPRQQTDEMAARWQTHVQSVTRPGTLRAAFNRSSVSMGDDTDDHWRLLIFDEDLPISTVLGPPIHRVLASIQGGHATWMVQLYEPLEEAVHADRSGPARPGRVRVTDVAVVAQQWPAPHLLGPDFPVSRIGTGTLYARYLAQQDPEAVIAAHQPASSPREQATHSSYTYDPESIPPEKRVMIRLVPREARPPS